MAENEGKGRRVLVAMSGGVDSSVTAALLKNQGYDVIGIHMQLSDQSESNLRALGGRCCSLVDSHDARRVCDKLDIPYYVINAQDEFEEDVIDYFVHEYLQARTPNPCVKCNSKIKFNYLFRKAEELDCEFVATGHYAQIQKDPGTEIYRMYKAVDEGKDQTYFLFGMSQKALSRTLMPLGGFPKKMIRKLAEEYEFAVADKPDSQEICFASEGYKAFIQAKTSRDLRADGQLYTQEGVIAGEHEGLYRYTIGQRKGLKLTIQEDEPNYVVGFDASRNVVIVGPERALYKDELLAKDSNWVAPLDRMRTIQCKARIRHRQMETDCLVTQYENKITHVKFFKPQRAVTPGQAIVFYKGGELLGGAFIDRVGAQPVPTPKV